jgi:hypothetical protein
MRDEYDFSRASVGKYAARYAKGTNVVLLDSDIADLFPDSKSVNDALRSLVKIAERRTRPRRIVPGPEKIPVCAGLRFSALHKKRTQAGVEQPRHLSLASMLKSPVLKAHANS